VSVNLLPTFLLSIFLPCLIIPFYYTLFFFNILYSKKPFTYNESTNESPFSQYFLSPEYAIMIPCVLLAGVLSVVGIFVGLVLFKEASKNKKK
jgi:hypothetical protein